MSLIKLTVIEEATGIRKPGYFNFSLSKPFAIFQRYDDCQVIFNPGSFEPSVLNFVETAEEIIRAIKAEEYPLWAAIKGLEDAINRSVPGPIVRL